MGGRDLTDWRSLRFGRSASSYHQATPVQRWMAQRLMELAPSDSLPNQVLELGCGTGHLTQNLAQRYPDADLVATDLSMAMLREAAGIWPFHLPRPTWRTLDARVPHEIGLSPQLVASNAVVQWFPDLESHFVSVRALCEPGSIYLLTGFCRDHFPEFDRILTSPEFGYGPGPGHDLSEVVVAARQAGWQVCASLQEAKPTTYASAMEFLRHLKASGANRLPPTGKPLTRSRLQHLLDRLSTEAASADGITITWKPWFLAMVAT